MAIVKVNFFSESLMRTVNFLAIIPIDKYSETENMVCLKEKPFKTLYLLHGILGSEYDWLTGTRINIWAQERNLAVIMPAGENKFYQDHPNSGDNFARFIGEELVSFTRNMFRLSEKREDTFIAGLSMGGMGALYAALRNSERFGYVGAFSSALVGADYPVDDRSSSLIKRKSFHEAMFGPEANYEGSENDYKALARRAVEKGISLPRIYMSCGESDFLLEKNRDYRDFLQSLNIPVDYFEDEGAHEWDFWDRHLYRFLEWLPL